MSNLDIDATLAELTTSEKIDLLTGRDFWHTYAIPRLDIPSIRMSDGPNGVRGIQFFNGPPAACLPCGTALGATWDTKLMSVAGRLLAAEAKAKGVHVVLGPTVNIPRSPLGGRGFESFSEDPFLSGILASSQIKGLQANGVGAALKHFVCNDQEHERKLYNAVVSDRALREIYMLPFQIAVRYSQPRAIMASYNKINGRHVSEAAEYLEDVLRKEWGFEGAIMSDWFGTYSVSGSVTAGLDLEMPGPPIWRGALLKRALTCGKVTEKILDRRVRKVLELVKFGANSDHEDIENSGNGSDCSVEERKLRIAFEKGQKGPNAKTAAFSGGGSAALNPYHVTTPFQSIGRKASSVQYSLGALGYDQLPLMNGKLRTSDGMTGFTLKIYLDPQECAERRMVEEIVVDDTLVMLVDYKHADVPGVLFFADLEAIFTPEEDGDYDFGLAVNGTGKLFVDDRLVIDNATSQRMGDSFLGAGTEEAVGTMGLKGGKDHSIKVHFGTAPTQTVSKQGAAGMGAGGLRLGCVRRFDPAEEVGKAVAIAKSSDQVVICTGQSAGNEAEGHDRCEMGLGSIMDEMISAVIAANSNTVVVVQSGTPISMPWAGQALAVVQAWYGGNEGGNAIADVLFGDANPCGRLPITFPIRKEDNPAFLNFRSEKGRVLYGEDIFVGYRFYEKVDRAVLFPFGHGLSYTTFHYSDLDSVSSKDGGALHISLNITNKGQYDGAEVVQVYVKHLNPSLIRPEKELKGFTKVFVPKSEIRRAEIVVDKRSATSFWDESRDEWVMEKGEYELLIGSSSDRIYLRESFKVERTLFWRGV